MLVILALHFIDIFEGFQFLNLCSRALNNLLVAMHIERILGSCLDVVVISFLYLWDYEPEAVHYSLAAIDMDPKNGVVFSQPIANRNHVFG